MGDLLKQVSRSFFLTLRALPGSVRPQIGSAYLLARATDTIADTRLVSVERRQAALREMRAAILAAARGRLVPLPDFGELVAAQVAPAGQRSFGEHALLESVGQVLEKLRGFGHEDRRRIGEVLETVTRGQEMDLMRFGFATANQIAALNTDAELNEYTYYVAGCVGEFWTKTCRAHLFPETELDDAFLLASSARFGKGLQLVNILRDLPKDLRQGRCYVPRARLAECDLSPHALLDPAAMGRFRPLYDSYLRQAEEHLAAGWSYTKALPSNQVRIRLACAWPALIGVKTLALLRAGNVLDDRDRIKVSRSEVRRLMLHSVFCYPWRVAWDRLFDLAKE